MAGNVWEWTRSLYEEYPYQADDGREDVKASGRRVLRGGSFLDNEWHARCSFRGDLDPDDEWLYFGCRVWVVCASWSLLGFWVLIEAEARRGRTSQWMGHMTANPRD
jgi:hypothetical protein